MKSRIIIICVLAVSIFSRNTYAQEAACADSSSIASAESASSSHPGLIKKIVNYFSEANKPIKHDGLHFSFLGGPHYSSDTKFGIGLVAAGQYYTSPATDTLTHLSNISLYGDVTTAGFYKVGIRGNHFTLGNRWRIDYNVSFYSFLRHYWGVGYERGDDVDNYTKFKELYIRAAADFFYYLAPNIYVGPSVMFVHVKGNDVTEPWRWEGQRLSTYTTSLGFTLMYDSRDNLTAPERGWRASVSQLFSPRFLANHYAHSTTDITASGYFRGWRGAVIALNMHSQLNFGKVPWGLLATFGGSDVMRGYYDGRFRDKCESDITIELRQHVWHRNGAVLWFGAGTVYNRPSDIKFKHFLPNAGIGYRWEFKKHTNVRLDFGVGKGETSFIFNINEAF